MAMAIYIYTESTENINNLANNHDTESYIVLLTSVPLFKTCFLLCLMMKINFHNHSFLMV